MKQNSNPPTADIDDELDELLEGLPKEIYEGCPCCRTTIHFSHYKSIHDGLVRFPKCGCDGTMPRDAYEDDKEYMRRAAMHADVIPLFLKLIDLEDQDKALRVKLLEISFQRRRVISDLMDQHRLSDHQDL